MCGAAGWLAADCTGGRLQPGVAGEKHRANEKGQARPMVPLSSDVTARTIGAVIRAVASARATCATDMTFLRRTMALGHQGQSRQADGLVLGQNDSGKQAANQCPPASAGNTAPPQRPGPLPPPWPGRWSPQ